MIIVYGFFRPYMQMLAVQWALIDVLSVSSVLSAMLAQSIASYWSYYEQQVHNNINYAWRLGENAGRYDYVRIARIAISKV